MRAMTPHTEGFADADGVKLFYEVFGEGEPTVVLVNGWQISHSREWKMNVPFLARRCRVITFDLPGNGRSDRPTSAEFYTRDRAQSWLPSIMDATSTDRAVLVGESAGTGIALLHAAMYPEQVLGLVLIGTAVAGADVLADPDRLPASIRDGFMSDFDQPGATDEGWDRFNRPYWRKDFEGFARFFIEQVVPEPHSSKLIEDFIGWALEGEQEAYLAAVDGMLAPDPDTGLNALESLDLLLDHVRCPALVITGDRDVVTPTEWSDRLAERIGADLVVFEGSGHVPAWRDPVKGNLLIREFVDRVGPPPPGRRTWARAAGRPKRALFVCSPIGLGHARRDVAIAEELRKIHPDLQVDWLTQHPVTAMLEHRGETVHPASRYLTVESDHWEAECGEHDLHAFEALRRMDEILVSNFHVFNDVVDDGLYDIVVADEAWDVNHYLYENPELKRSAFCWLTDFVGFLPVPEGGERDVLLTADYNAEMMFQVARYPRIRDRAIFVGEPDDIVEDRLGPGLPPIREWTQQHFDFAGHITGFEPVADRDALRERLGYRPDERVCIAAVGGTGVGSHLLRRVVDAFPLVRRSVDDFRMVVVCGPRIDPARFPERDGLEIHGYVPDLYQHLAVCDLAVVQGGLTTCMELVTNRRPFVYVPLRNHFEQQRHVRHRLERHRAGRHVPYEDAAEPDALAAAMLAELGRDCSDYVDVPADGAARAAALMADLI